jgi:hypothetical protein
MLEHTLGRNMFPSAESHFLRVEAMQLFEQCLTNGDTAALTAFIERQLLHEPPRLQLLRDIADDLQQRLLSLREYHFDVRERVVTMLNDSYGVDITPLAPPALLEEYHSLTVEQVLAFVQQQGIDLDENDCTLLRKMIDASIQMAAQLNNDIRLTIQLHTLVVDWLDGINATVARQYWNSLHALTQGPEKNPHH